MMEATSCVAGAPSVSATLGPLPELAPSDGADCGSGPGGGSDGGSGAADGEGGAGARKAGGCSTSGNGGSYVLALCLLALRRRAPRSLA